MLIALEPPQFSALLAGQGMVQPAEPDWALFMIALPQKH
jgi:hypothetical protein